MFFYGYPQRSDDSNSEPYAQTFTVRGGQPYLDDAILRERAQVLAEQRARKAKWLPDEVDNSYDESDYTELGPQELAYIDALRKEQVVEHLWRQQEAQALEEAARHREQQEKWQQELKKKQREDEEARHKLLEKRMQITREEAARAIAYERLLRAQQQERQQERNWSKFRGPGLQSRPENDVPLNFRRTTSPQSTTPLHPPSETHAVPESKSQSYSKAIYDEKHDNAASRIQQQYRIHKSHRILNNLDSQFQTLKQNFVYPRVVDFQKPGSDDGHITVRANTDEEAKDEPSMEVDGEDGELAYTPVNYPLHTYADAMEKLVMKLDGVDSMGDKGVREKRRLIVREISKESTNLEGYCKRIWLDYVEKRNEEERKLELEKELEKRQAETELESQAMDIDEEPVHVEHHEAKEDVDEWIDVAGSANAPEVNGVPQGEPTRHLHPLTKHIPELDHISQPAYTDSPEFTPEMQSIELGVDPTSIPQVSN